MAISLDEPTFLGTFLHYGLFLGAIFQLVCIFAVIALPKTDYDDEEEEVTEGSKQQHPTQQHTAHTQPSSKKSRKEKKKHR